MRSIGSHVDGRLPVPKVTLGTLEENLDSAELRLAITGWLVSFLSKVVNDRLSFQSTVGGR